MADPATPVESSKEGGGFLAPPPGSHPVDHCVRCGVETPAGVALCDEHNPTGISSPSATQMHATVFGGLVVGVIGLFIFLGFTVGSTGPYETSITSSVADPAGGVALAFTVSNQGDKEGVPDCRVTRDGVPRPDDLAFRAERVPAGQSLLIEKITPGPPLNSVGYRADAVTVVCT